MGKDKPKDEGRDKIGPCPKGGDHDWEHSGHEVVCKKCGSFEIIG